MENQFSRSELMLGTDGIQKLKNSRVAIFGIGGVGSYAAESLIRCGLGAIDLIDNDKISITNINRQLYATLSTVGKYKTEVARERIYDINPDAIVKTYNTFYLPENAEQFNFSDYDYIIDAIDTVTAKIDIATRADKLSVPVISAMGAGNKLDATAFEVSDIYKTSVCPLAKVMRYELKKRGVKKLKVVYSKETPALTTTKDSDGRRIPASISFVPPVVGMIIAGEVIKDICKI